MAIVKLFDPLGQIGESTATGDGEVRELAILNVAVGRLGEGVNITDKVGFQELNALFKVIHLLLVLFFFTQELLFEAVTMCFGGDDKSIDDGPVGGCVEGVSGNGTSNGLGGEPPKGNEVVDGSGVPSGEY